MLSLTVRVDKILGHWHVVQSVLEEVSEGHDWVLAQRSDTFPATLWEEEQDDLTAIRSALTRHIAKCQEDDTPQVWGDRE